jgi:glutathione S-transferase
LQHFPVDLPSSLREICMINPFGQENPMLTLYGVFRSRASRPLWLLGECGAEYRHIPVIQAYRLPNAAAADAPLNTASAEFLAVNPMGQIPALTDGDLLLTESLAMTLHIARTRGGDLGPRDAAELAQMENWSLFAATSVEVPALEILFAAQDGADTAESKGVIAIAAEKLRRPFARLDRHLSAADYLVGNRFTAADINTAECCRYAQGNAPLMAEFPALDAWMKRCQSRPAFQAMWAGRLAEPA